MGRPKKEDTMLETNIETEVKTIAPPKVDVNKLVKSVQGRYGKNQALASDLTIGSKIRLSTEDDDYILSEEVRKWWEPLSGCKGIPFGRMAEIAGKADSGKSTTAMLFMKAAQEAGVLVILWDSEKKFSISRYKNNIGGDPDTVCITRSKNILEGAQQVCWYVKAAKEQNPDIKVFVVWDSVGSTLSSLEDSAEDDYSKQPGQFAKQVGWAVKKFNSLIERYRDVKTGKETVAVLCINQVYAMIGSVGSKEKGGEQIYYLSSLILQLSRKKDLIHVVNKQKMKYGIVTRAKVKKNHLFDGKETIAELDLVVSADGIKLENEVNKDGLEEADDE